MREERGEFAGEWTKAQADYLDAVDLRRTLRTYLERGGVEPEDIEALAREIARGRGP